MPGCWVVKLRLYLPCHYQMIYHVHRPQGTSSCLHSRSCETGITCCVLLELCMPSVPLHGTRARGPASQRATAVDVSSVARQQSRVFQMFLGPAPRVHEFGSGIRWWQQLICCAMDGTHERRRINAGTLCSQPSAARSRTGPMLFCPLDGGGFWLDTVT